MPYWTLPNGFSVTKWSLCLVFCEKSFSNEKWRASTENVSAAFVLLIFVFLTYIYIWPLLLSLLHLCIFIYFLPYCCPMIIVFAPRHQVTVLILTFVKKKKKFWLNVHKHKIMTSRGKKIKIKNSKWNLGLKKLIAIFFFLKHMHRNIMNILIFFPDAGPKMLLTFYKCYRYINI